MKKKKIFFLILFLILALSYILLFSPLFKIRSLEVLGNRELGIGEIEEKFNYGNIFLVTENRIKNDLIKGIPKIGDLEISKNFIKRKIKLSIIERKEIGIVCREEYNESMVGKCFYIDKQGIVFEQAPQTSGSLVLLIKDYSQREYFLGKKIFEEKTISSILEIKETLFLEMDLSVSEFSFLSFPTKDLKVITNEKWYIVFDIEGDIKKQLLSLKTVLEEKIQERENLEYIDLRIENRVYYK